MLIIIVNHLVVIYAHIQNLAENNVVDNVQGTNRWIGGFQNCNNSSYSNPNGGWEWSNGNNSYLIHSGLLESQTISVENNAIAML